jgi:hypothetical protein
MRFDRLVGVRGFEPPRAASGARITVFLSDDRVAEPMAFEEDDRVILHDEHSEYDGETGTVTQVMDNMFGDATYTVSFEDGQEQGLGEDQLEAAAADQSEE